ncbi:MAG: sugar phosphate nucleotidyltransferase [Chloroflexota bacterium]|nr:sugar phosphate nucleotidyltransferase [Chloroflexota bacterium]
MTAGPNSRVQLVKVGVVPAGGLGTRFLPITRSVPKELLPIVDTAVIELVVSELVSSGIERVVLVVGPGKESIAGYFKPQPKIEERLAAGGRSDELALLKRPEGLAEFQSVVQAEAKGNGHAVLIAADLVGDQPFAVLWGDDLMFAAEPPIAQLLRERERLGGGSIVGCVRVPKKDAGRYGMVAGAAERGATRVRAIIEKPAPEDAPSDLAAVHGYVLEPEIFEVLASLPPGRGGEIWLTDGITALAKGGAPVWAVEVEGQRYDAGDKAGYVAAFLDSALGREDTGPATREHLKTLGWRPPDR